MTLQGEKDMKETGDIYQSLRGGISATGGRFKERMPQTLGSKIRFISLKKKTRTKKQITPLLSVYPAARSREIKTIKPHFQRGEDLLPKTMFTSPLHSKLSLMRSS